MYVPMKLGQMLAAPQASIEPIGAYLDSLTHNERLSETMVLNRHQQRTLYELAAQAPPLTLSHFVEETRSSLTPVRHFGRNTLPLPGRFRYFEKRFVRPGDGSDRLFGYNEAAVRKLIGPGYFVALSTSNHARWQARGSVVIDYLQVPEGPIPPAWPPLVANHHGLQRFVYNQTRDFMRRVSCHVSIGAAYKLEHPLDQYFVLCREP